MDVKAKTIGKIENDFKEDPTEKLLKEISNEKITKLLQILYQMKRHDVLNIFYREICSKSEGKIHSAPIWKHLILLHRAWEKNIRSGLMIVTCCKQDTRRRTS